MKPIKTIHITGEKELRIFMLPLRQDILRLLAAEGPMTAKEISQALEITPSSAKHHLTKLESLGLVELDHTRLIHGITARYYRGVVAEVRLGAGRKDDGLRHQRMALVRTLVSRTLEGFFRHMEEAEPHPDRGERDFEGDVRHGILHLTPREARELDRSIQEFIRERENPREGTQPFEYALVAYHSGSVSRPGAGEKEETHGG